MSSDSGHKLVNHFLSDLVYAVIIVAVFREVAGGLEVYDNAVFVADGLNLCVLDSGKGVSHDGKTCYTGSKITLNVSVMKRHLCPFIAVFVMHIVDNIQGVYINVCLPLQHIDELAHNIVVVKHVTCNRTILGTYLLLGNFIHTAVQSVQQTFCNICTCAEELHFLTDNHRRYAASDTIVIAMCHSHQVIVLILNGRSLDRHLCTVSLPAFRKLCGPQYGQVRLGRRSKVGQGVQITEAHLCYHGSAVNTHTA